jgi:hypothetical protein
VGKSRTGTSKQHRGALASVVVGLLLASHPFEAGAQQFAPAAASPWNWRAWMFAGGGERLTDPEDRRMAMGAYIGRTVGDGGLVAGFRFGAAGADSQQVRSAMFSLTLRLNPVRESPTARPVGEALGWRSAIAGPVVERRDAFAVPDAITSRLIDPTLRMPSLDMLPGREADPLEIGRVGLELLVPAAPLM